MDTTKRKRVENGPIEFVVTVDAFRTRPVVARHWISLWNNASLYEEDSCLQLGTDLHKAESERAAQMASLHKRLRTLETQGNFTVRHQWPFLGEQYRVDLSVQIKMIPKDVAIAVIYRDHGRGRMSLMNAVFVISVGHPFSPDEVRNTIASTVLGRSGWLDEVMGCILQEYSDEGEFFVNEWRFNPQSDQQCTANDLCVLLARALMWKLRRQRNAEQRAAEGTYEVAVESQVSAKEN